MDKLSSRDRLTTFQDISNLDPARTGWVYRLLVGLIPRYSACRS